MAAEGVNRAVALESFDPENPTSTLKIIERPIPEPASGEVLVRISLRPVNPSDVSSITGNYAGFKLPEDGVGIPGGDALGTVAKLGADVTGLQVGQRVVSLVWPTGEGRGTWQQYAVMPAAALIPVPDVLSDEVASQFRVNPLTAYAFVDTLEREGLLQTRWVVSSAAASALGHMFASYARHKGIRTINLVRRDDAAEGLRAAGADVVINTETTADLAAAIREATGGAGADAHFECVGGDLTGVAGGLRDGGVIFAYGALGERNVSVPIPDLLFRYVSVRGFWLSLYFKESTQEQRVGALKNALQAMAEGKLVVPAGGKRFSLDQVKEAVAESVRPGRGGKVFLEG